VLLDVDMIHLRTISQNFNLSAKVLIPVESEYYGMNQLKEFIAMLNEINREIEGFIPVMVRSNSETSLNLIKELKSYFGNMVFEPGILRNYYLARQKDFKKFQQSDLTEKSAVTYLNLANTLMDR
jgi:cellulose biosynthesis protein BcsQ